MHTYARATDGLIHACDGTLLEDGSAVLWRLCDGGAVPAAALHAHPRPAKANCRNCRALEDATAILTRPTLGCGPPELVSSSWPAAFRR
jgi:hypothetical protein